MKVLRDAPHEKEMQRQQMPSRRNAEAVGTGERSEKIHYNFPQNRITDHRINYTTHRLTEVLNGDCRSSSTPWCRTIRPRN